MQYRTFGNTGVEVSALGFGTMRLPLLEDGVTVDEKEAVAIIRRAIDAGVNYVDTAYPYHNGASELVLGKLFWTGIGIRFMWRIRVLCGSWKKKRISTPFWRNSFRN